MVNLQQWFADFGVHDLIEVLAERTDYKASPLDFNLIGLWPKASLKQTLSRPVGCVCMCVYVCVSNEGKQVRP